MADSGAVLIAESNGVPVPIAAARSSSSPVAAEAIKRPATPPRLPPGASAPLPVGGRAHRGSGVDWGAVALPTALALGLLVAIARRPPPPPPPAAPPLPSPTVHVALDSTPQGATVTNTLGSTLGETPLIIDLPRGSAPVDLVLNKTGYLPLTFKVLPHQDRELTAALEHVPPPPPPEEPVAIRPGRRGIERPPRAAGRVARPRADRPRSGNDGARVRAGTGGETGDDGDPADSPLSGGPRASGLGEKSDARGLRSEALSPARGRSVRGRRLPQCRFDVAAMLHWCSSVLLSPRPRPSSNSATSSPPSLRTTATTSRRWSGPAWR